MEAFLFLRIKYLLWAVLCAALDFSEAAAQQVVPPLKKEFLDSAFAVLPSAAGARYRRETEWRDSTAGVVRDYFLSGQLQSREEFESIRRHRYHGASEYFNQTGQLVSHQEYTHGEATGEHRRYYPSGQLKRLEHYAAGKRLDGACFGPGGEVLPYFDYYIRPVYSEGDGSLAAITAAVAKRFHYPDDAQRARIQGFVVLTFTVNTQGQTENIRVVEGLWPSVNEEAVLAVRKLRKFIPARVDGQLSEFHFQVPIILKL